MKIVKEIFDSKGRKRSIAIPDGAKPSNRKRIVILHSEKKDYCVVNKQGRILKVLSLHEEEAEDIGEVYTVIPADEFEERPEKKMVIVGENSKGKKKLKHFAQVITEALENGSLQHEISSKDLYNTFTEEEKELLEGSDDVKIKVLLKRISMNDKITISANTENILNSLDRTIGMSNSRLKEIKEKIGKNKRFNKTIV